MTSRSHYSRRKTHEEQYRLVLECRTSGLTDYQWCSEHGIKPGTFHSWVERLKKHPEYTIPPRKAREIYVVEPKQDVVKLEITDDPNPNTYSFDDDVSTTCIASPSSAIEIQAGSMVVRINNQATPSLFLKSSGRWEVCHAR